MTGPVSPVDPRDERLREITLAVLDVLRAQGRPELPRSSGTGLPKVVGVVRANWVLVVGIVTVALALFAWIVKGVSPLHAVDEVALRQEQRRLQRELVRRSIYLGNDFLNLGQTAAADSEFTQATALDPLDIEARFGLLKTAVFRSISLAAPDQELTERRLRAILEQRPGDTHALRFLGDVYANLDVDSAFAYYERALASDSANAHAYFGIAYLYD
jgi:tetratricopeptide (TPR) repeat protein